ncbi:hypothetical protein Cmtc_08930 [Cupriavidus sp. TKC]|uniref:baseplate hub protein n=1 Tax=Cupriavidus sp. TKC TaxID=2880159 RepID=UPI0025A76BAB|nr:hypothetical protein [Cupriavidus sp. TKC]GMG89673.1 hypothetical protein Cmtc_08930 [Cupriavidus sp. TKC]
MSFTRKRIDVTISLGTGTFGESGADTVTLSGLRVQAMVHMTPGDTMPYAQIRVFGLPLEMLNQLTAVGLVNSGVRYHNTVLLAAGDDETGLSTIFNGGIDESFANMDGMPESCLEIITMAGLAASLKPVGALSFQGQADVATIMKGIADQMGVAFEKNGVQVQLANPYFPGTALAQAKACARAADIWMTIDRGTLAIWPKSGARAEQGEIPLISVATGMRGYPRFCSKAIEVSSLFNPLVRPGGKVRIESSLKAACGTFYVSDVTHILESEAPNGQWFTRVIAHPQNV